MTFSSETQRLLDRIKKSQLDTGERIEIGTRLAELGDPRPGVGLRENGLPDIDWVRIPAGEFIFGSRMGDLTATLNEVPQLSLYLPEYAISRYPVTYAQYEAFVSSGGYRVKHYWTQTGLKWRGRKQHPVTGWNDPEWHIANHPVIGVTWHEALAFCCWLSDKTGYDIWLPGETEWEKAARGADGRRFPWGKQFYSHCVNCLQIVQADQFSRETEVVGVGHTTAVGLYPDGASPYGVLDMCGNVWEWCADLWRESYNEPERKVLEGTKPRALRGGAWNERETSVRTASRKGLPPDASANNVGFRVCAASKG